MLLMNTLSHAPFSVHSRIAHWHAILSVLRSTLEFSDKLTLCCSLVIFDRKVLCITRTNVVNLDVMPVQHALQVVGPTAVQMEVGQKCCLSWTAAMKV